MEFLVRVDGSRAYELPADESAALIERERVRGRELMATGTIRHFWRIPGRRANIGGTQDKPKRGNALVGVPIG
jgi:muconolactone D-isomerase